MFLKKKRNYHETIYGGPIGTGVTDGGAWVRAAPHPLAS